MMLSFILSISLPGHFHAETIDDLTTGAVLSFPSVSDGSLYNKTFDVMRAGFGYQASSGSIQGYLILPMNKTYHTECPKCGEPLGKNPYIKYINDWFIAKDDITDYIMVIDGKECYYIDQVKHAQQLGASGVIICDYKNEDLFSMWPPKDSQHDIDIPSVLLGYNDCKTLMDHIGLNNWDPNNISNMEYPDVETMSWTIATIEWGVTHPDDKVEYELWTSSNDYLGAKFKHNFNKTATELDRANDTIFMPHMYILNGSHWNCDEIANGKAILPCKKQCTNSGRYCAVDPEYDLSLGLDGMDIIQENLRSLCVWEYDKEYFGRDDVMWWDYAVLWDENCGVYSNSSLNFNVNCSFAQMDKLNADGSLSQYVKNCISSSGGYGYEDGINTILNRETKLKYNLSISTVPSVLVNGFLINGTIDCEPDQPKGFVTTSNCRVLAAICTGFVQGRAPDICYLSPAPTIANCSDNERDCMGECYGEHSIDACGECLLSSSHEWNKCMTQTTTKTGSGSQNPSGYESSQPTTATTVPTLAPRSVLGCSGNKILDKCGKCLTKENTTRDSCIGCDGIAYSGKEYNDCGVCVSKDDVYFDDYGKDCRGECFGSSELVYHVDDCGQCLLPTDDKWNECIIDIDTTPLKTSAADATIKVGKDLEGKEVIVVDIKLLLGCIIGVVVLIICCILIGVYVYFKRLKYNEYKLQERMIVHNELEGHGMSEQINDGEQHTEGETDGDALNAMQTL